MHRAGSLGSEVRRREGVSLFSLNLPFNMLSIRIANDIKSSRVFGDLSHSRLLPQLSAGGFQRHSSVWKMNGEVSYRFNGLVLWLLVSG